jgi:asparagine synthase (glutamine-hydrolysing)
LGTIFGIISKQGDQIDEELLQKCLKASCPWSPNDSATWLNSNIAFAYQQVVSSSGVLRDGLIIHSSGCTIAADCRIDYREELAIKLEINPRDLFNISDIRLILMSYLEWGESCVEYLAGDFAFAIWDKNNHKLFCARDQMGCRPFYYFEDDKYFLFSSQMNGFEPVPGVKFIPQERYILYHFSSKVLPKDKTLYEGINRLAPAYSLVFYPESSPVLKRYWDLDLDPECASLSIEIALDRFISIFRESVAQRIRNFPALGIELSGGLDSSSVAVVAKEVKQRGVNIHAFVNALSDEHRKEFYPFYDETSYGRSVADYANLDSFHVINGLHGKGSMEAVMESVKITHSPVVQLFPIFSDQLLDKVQEQGIHLLLSGFGGDECVTYSAQGILDEYAMKGDWKEVRLAISDKPLRKMIPILVKLWLEHRYHSFMEFVRRIFNGRKGFYRISDLAMDSSFQKAFRKIEKEWKAAENPPEYRIREKQRLRLMNESVSDRLENSYNLAQKRNIEYAYPLLDIKLITFVYSLPVDFKYRNGLGRYMMRMAMDGLIPDEIRLRASKFGATIPNLFYRFHLDQGEYFNLIDEAEKCNEFHYLNYNKLRWQIGKLMDQKNFLKLSFGPRIFFSSISLLILQKWKRDGKMKTGIKC